MNVPTLQTGFVENTGDVSTSWVRMNVLRLVSVAGLLIPQQRMVFVVKVSCLIIAFLDASFYFEVVDLSFPFCFI